MPFPPRRRLPQHHAVQRTCIAFQTSLGPYLTIHPLHERAEIILETFHVLENWLQNRLKPFASNDVEQGERWAFGLFGAALQLRDIARGEIQIAGEGGLT